MLRHESVSNLSTFQRCLLPPPIALMMETVSTSKTLGNLYQNTHLNTLEHSQLQVVTLWNACYTNISTSFLRYDCADITLSHVATRGALSTNVPFPEQLYYETCWISTHTLPTNLYLHNNNYRDRYVYEIRILNEVFNKGRYVESSWGYYSRKAGQTNFKRRLRKAGLRDRIAFDDYQELIPFPHP
jgi:hypothetical protein